MILFAVLYVAFLALLLWFGRKLRKFREAREPIFTDVHDWDSLTREYDDASV